MAQYSMVLSETLAVPMKVGSDGTIRVGGTRVGLDRVIYAFNEGYIAEEITSQYLANVIKLRVMQNKNHRKDLRFREKRLGLTFFFRAEVR